MKWKEFILHAYRDSPNAIKSGSQPVFYQPVTDEEIETLQTKIRKLLPLSLRSLLQETNGVAESIQIDGKSLTHLTWICPVSTQLELNDPDKLPDHWKDYLIFGLPGVDGIYFAFDDRTLKSANNDSVYIWYPIEQRFERAADSLEAFVRGWIIGSIVI